MKAYLIIIALACLATGTRAQSSVAEVLREVEQNNKELQANQQLSDAGKWQARTENNLPDPSVSYTHQYGNKSELGVQGELVASQSFDFPLVYAQRRQWVKAKSSAIDHQYGEVRERVLLQAKEACLDLILLNQQKQLLDIRRQNAEQLSALYEMRLQNGDANILETNKINLELLNAKTEARMNEAARVAKLQELAALNGGIPVAFADTVYSPIDLPLSFDELRLEAMRSNVQLLSLKSEQVAAERQIGVSKAMGLPGLELGYRLNTAAGGERFNGFIVGISVPLFSNRHKVRQAKAENRSARLQLENASFTVENELQTLYNQALSLRASMDEYDRIFHTQNNLALLNKAIQAGQISMIEYFVDVTTYYQSMQNYFKLQNQYQKVMAQLYRFRL